MTVNAGSVARHVFQLYLIKPSHYDDDGYVIQWLRSDIPSNTMAMLNGIALECSAARVLGEAVDIVITTLDEANHRIKPQKIIREIGVKKHLIIDVDLSSFGGSALTDDIFVPKREKVEDISKEIPVTYVPARNIIFLSLALGWAEVLDSTDIFIGVNAIDYSGYPDCRVKFIKTFEEAANLGTKSGVEGKRINIHTPLILLTKGEIIKKGLELGVDYSLTHSCYDPDEEGRACGMCDSCLLRKKGFKEAEVEDPTVYT